MGLVTALGHDVATTWPRLVRGERGLSPLSLFDVTGQRAAMVASVPGVVVPPDDAPSRWSRTSAFAWKAADEALRHAGIGAAARWRAEGRRVGLVVGGTTGGMYETEALLADLHANPDSTESLVRMISHPLTATGDRLGETLGPFCRVRSICTACSSGANAFLAGAIWLLAREVDAVVVGGSDGLCRLTLSGFNALAATDPDRCRPFDAARKGINLGEGAGFAVLERASSARARGASPIAELGGWAVGAEAHHITNPEPTGAAAARVIARSLRRAGLSPREVDYVNAHGTATPLNDAMEAAGLQSALGAEVLRVPVSSSKGQVGHMLGAAGAAEAIFSALAVKDQVVLPTMGLEEPDDACRLVHVLHTGRPARVRAALSSSFGFGGMDTVLVLTEPELGPPLTSPGRRVVVTGVSALTPRGFEDGETAGALVDGAQPAPASAVTIDLAAHLDAARARRLDRPARLGAVVTDKALLQAEAGAARLDRAEVGLVLGNAFGSLDASAAFVHRILEKGPRFASPAEFPNLVPSSPVGHVSIYEGFLGPTLATADLGTSGESAVAQAIELIESGEGDVLVAGAVEEASDLVRRILVCLVAGASSGDTQTSLALATPRTEGAAALLLEEEAHAARRGARILASIRVLASWTGAAPGSLAPPGDVTRALVVRVHDSSEADEIIARSAWASALSTTLDGAGGENEGVGATALVAATSLVQRGSVREVLVVGTARGRGYAIAVCAPDASLGAVVP